MISSGPGGVQMGVVPRVEYPRRPLTRHAAQVGVKWEQFGFDGVALQSEGPLGYMGVMREAQIR